MTAMLCAGIVIGAIVTVVVQTIVRVVARAYEARSLKDWLRFGYSKVTGSNVDYHDLENRVRLLQEENDRLRVRLIIAENREVIEGLANR